MRIGMLTDAYHPYLSGVTNYISLNKRALEGWGRRVFVFTFGNKNYPSDESDVVRTPALPLFNTGFSLGLRYSPAAQRELHTLDIAHVHHPFFSGRLALRHCRRRGIPVVFTNHTRYDLYAQAYLPFLPPALSDSLLRAYLPRFCAACDLVIAPSAGLRQALHTWGVTAQIDVIPNGIDLVPFQSARGRRRAELGLLDSDSLLVYSGRLGPEKNLAFLLRAFAAARAQSETLGKLHLLLVGDGPKANYLRHQARRLGVDRYLHFTGRVPYSEVPDLLALADIFVTASLTEAHPLSLIEALASGLPAIGIPSPGISDTICDGLNGLLSANDPQAFAALIVRLIQDVELRRRLAAGAKESALQYDIRRTAASVLVHYERLIEARRI